MILTLIILLIVVRLLTRGWFYRPMGGWFFGMPRRWRHVRMRCPRMGFGPHMGFGPGTRMGRW